MAEPTLPTTTEGTLFAGSSISITPSGESPTAVPINNLIDCTLPKAQLKKATFIPQNGENAGLEQVKLGSEQSAQLQIVVTYEKANHDAMLALKGVNGCAISVTLPDGSVYAGTGGVEGVDSGKGEDTKVLESTVTVALNAGWTFTPGT